MTIRRFHVFGQRCSGTNALTRLIERNFPDLQFCESAGFKHWFVPADRAIAPDAVVVVIAREVGEWLHSLHAQPWHARPELAKLPFSHFIRAEWQSIWDSDFWGVEEGDAIYGTPIREEQCPDTGRPFANAVTKRTAKLRNWLDLEARSSAFLRVSHTDLVLRPERIVANLAALIERAPTRSFVPVDSYKGEGRRTFEPKKYPALAEGDRLFVRQHLDPAVEAAFGLSAMTGGAGATDRSPQHGT